MEQLPVEGILITKHGYPVARLIPIPRLDKADDTFSIETNLSIHLPEVELLRLQSAAAERGVSVETAVHQALEAWSSEPAGNSSGSIDLLQGSLADVDVFRLLREERQADHQRDKHFSR